MITAVDFTETEEPSERLLDAIHELLPWAALAPFAVCAERHKVSLRFDDEAACDFNLDLNALLAYREK